MHALALLPLLALAVACGVPEAKYDLALNDAQSARDAEKKTRGKLEDEVKTLREELAVAAGKATSDEDKAKLEELQKAHEEAKARAELLASLVDKFKQMVDAGTLKVVERHGRLVLQLRNDVLFDPLKTEIKPDGKVALVQIAQTLRTMPTRRFQVAGHTDVVVIHTKDFPSNWELSTGRAIAVVKLLVAQGVNPASLSAAGYSLYDPVGTEPTHNRRIEITLVPNVEGLISAKGGGR